MKSFKIIRAIFAAAVFFYGYCIYQVWTYSNYYYEVESDVAIVLGAGIKDGKLSPVFQERMNHGIDLYKRGKVSALILTGGNSENEAISDSQAAKNYAVQNGVSESAILIEELSTITYYNIVYAQELMENYKLETALLISDPYHIRRSVAMCKKAGIDALPSPTPTTMYRSSGVKRKFLLKEGFFYALFILFGQFR